MYTLYCRTRRTRHCTNCTLYNVPSLWYCFLRSCILAFLCSSRHILSRALMSLYGIFCTLPNFPAFSIFSPYSHFCGTIQAHLYCTCAAKHQCLQYHKAVRPALYGIQAADDRRTPALRPFPPRVFPPSSCIVLVRWYDTVPVSINKVILLFSFYLPSPPLHIRCIPLLPCYSCLLAFWP